MKNFGEFFNNQIESAHVILLSRTQEISEKKLKDTVAALKEHNPTATIITTPWDQISGKEILEVMEQRSNLDTFMNQTLEEQEHHHDHEHEHCHCHEHDHDHEHECHCHDHDHHHHHADDVFMNWGTETVHTYTKEELETILKNLNQEQFGTVLRAKGIVAGDNGIWYHFDMVPEELDIRQGHLHK